MIFLEIEVSPDFIRGAFAKTTDGQLIMRHPVIELHNGAYIITF